NLQAIAQTFLNRTHVIYQDKGTLFDFNLLTFLMSDWVKIKAPIFRNGSDLSGCSKRIRKI
ncbi:hypothetical protein, partial [Leptospira borgpetersenii]|uniref:hypothetical protein n=1 Tax=Leptospira borgpetersenii TaxID=174 RepID=UPI000AD122E6